MTPTVMSARCLRLCLRVGMILESSCEASLARRVHVQCRGDQAAPLRGQNQASCCVFVAASQADGSMSPAVAETRGARTSPQGGPITHVTAAKHGTKRRRNGRQDPCRKSPKEEWPKLTPTGHWTLRLERDSRALQPR